MFREWTTTAFQSSFSLQNSAVAPVREVALYCVTKMSAKAALSALASTTQHGSLLLQTALPGGPKPARVPKHTKKACCHKWKRDASGGSNHRITLHLEGLTPATDAVAAADPGSGCTATCRSAEATLTTSQLLSQHITFPTTPHCFYHQQFLLTAHQNGFLPCKSLPDRHKMTQRSIIPYHTWIVWPATVFSLVWER